MNTNFLFQATKKSAFTLSNAEGFADWFGDTLNFSSSSGLIRGTSLSSNGILLPDNLFVNMEFGYGPEGNRTPGTWLDKLAPDQPGPIPISLSQLLSALVNESASQSAKIATISGMILDTARMTQDISASLSAIPQIRTELDQVRQEMASVSARLAKVEEKTASNSADLSNLTGPNIDIASFSAELATISGNLTVLGKTQLADTSIGGSLSIGLLHFDDLKAEISALTGQVTINSNLNVIGDATVSGQLKVGKGIVLKDTTTGDSYCVEITNGEIVKKKGECL